MRASSNAISAEIRRMRKDEDSYKTRERHADTWIRANQAKFERWIEEALKAAKSHRACNGSEAAPHGGEADFTAHHSGMVETVEQAFLSRSVGRHSVCRIDAAQPPPVAEKDADRTILGGQASVPATRSPPALCRASTITGGSGWLKR